MAPVDYGIVALYLVGMLTIGFLLRRRASAGIESYFLGNRRLPWWMLGASGMASNVDVSGTMIIVAFLYAIGAKGFFIELRGGVVLVMAFLLVFSGKWIRRAGVMTNAEWMWFRFGRGPDGRLARIISAVAEVAFTIGAVSYFAKGGGKFIGEMIGVPDDTAALLMVGITMLYAVAGGLVGVVVTDVVQGAIMLAGILLLSGYTMATVTLPETFSVGVPLPDGGVQAVRTTAAEWTSILPPVTASLPGDYAIYNMFALAIGFYLLKNVVEGSSGSGGYIAQRFYAAKNEREVGLLSLFWIVLLSFRWPFVAAIAVLGIVYSHGTGTVLDPERVLPVVISTYFPAGARGLMVTALMAAAMSTFTSIVNGGAGYWVRDIYQATLRPEASERDLVRMSRIASAGIVVFGVALSYGIRTVNEIWGWLTMGIGAGLLVPMFLRWFWWRFNGYGFAAGIVTGMTAAIAQKLLLPDSTEYVSFLAAALPSLAAAVATTLLTPRTPASVLEAFYRSTRPFGFWNPVRAALNPAEIAGVRAEHRRDLLSLSIAVPWQLILFLTMMSIVLKNWPTVAALGVALAILSWLLYTHWYRRLPVSTSGEVPTEPR